MGFGELYAMMEELIKIYIIKKLVCHYALDTLRVFMYQDDYSSMRGWNGFSAFRVKWATEARVICAQACTSVQITCAFRYSLSLRMQILTFSFIRRSLLSNL